MNQIECTVMMRKYYNARWVSDSSEFRFQKGGHFFSIDVRFGGTAGKGAWIERLSLFERVMPDDENGRVKVEFCAALDEIPAQQDNVRRWINKELIRAVARADYSISAQIAPTEFTPGR